jgi:hypothetical protein
LSEDELPGPGRKTNSRDRLKSQAFNQYLSGLKYALGAATKGGETVTADKIRTILKLYTDRYDDNWRLKSNFREGMNHLLSVHGDSRTNNIPVLIPLELELTIDGIGGIYPGNSYHSNYVPNRYKDEAIFQCFDVNHNVDSSGWTVILQGKMRATLHGLYTEIYTAEENVKTLVDEIMKDMKLPAAVQELVNPIAVDGTIKSDVFHNTDDFGNLKDPITGLTEGDEKKLEKKKIKKDYAGTSQKILTYIKGTHWDSSNYKKFLELTKGWTPDERKALRTYFDEHIAPGSHSKKKHPQNGKLKEWLEWDMKDEYLKWSKSHFGIN